MRCTRGVNPRPQEARHGVGCRYGVLQHSQERIEVRVPDCCHRFPLVTNDQLCADRPAEYDGRSDLNECRQRDFLSLLPEPLSGLGVLAPEGVEDHDRTVIGMRSELVDHGGLVCEGRDPVNSPGP